MIGTSMSPTELIQFNAERLESVIAQVNKLSTQMGVGEGPKPVDLGPLERRLRALEEMVGTQVNALQSQVEKHAATAKGHTHPAVTLQHDHPHEHDAYSKEGHAHSAVLEKLGNLEQQVSHLIALLDDGAERIGGHEAVLRKLTPRVDQLEHNGLAQEQVNDNLDTSLRTLQAKVASHDGDIQEQARALNQHADELDKAEAETQRLAEQDDLHARAVDALQSQLGALTAATQAVVPHEHKDIMKAAKAVPEHFHPDLPQIGAAVDHVHDFLLTVEREPGDRVYACQVKGCTAKMQIRDK